MTYQDITAMAKSIPLHADVDSGVFFEDQGLAGSLLRALESKGMSPEKTREVVRGGMNYQGREHA